MILSKYGNFILESRLYDLLLEAQIYYLNDFKDVLLDMKPTSTIAKDLLDIIGQDIKVTTNFIGVKSDKLTFLPTNIKVKFKVKDSRYSYLDVFDVHGSFTSLFNLAGLTDDDITSPNNGQIGEIIKVYTNSDLDNIPVGNKIAHFVTDDNENCFMGIDGLEPVVPNIAPQETMVGRLTSKLLKAANKEFKERELEEFVNKFKAKLEILNNRFNLFELVEGEKIAYWYYDARYDYTRTSTLQGSCMRGAKCQKYFGIYTENPSVCKLLILKNDEGDKIKGRALVWTLADGTIFMDRIYYSHDTQIELFKEFARLNGWCYKAKQESSSATDIHFNSEKKYTDTLVVKLEKSYFKDYPYMDTLKYLNEDYNTISTSSSGDTMELESTDGGRPGDECDMCNGEERVDCPECDGNGDYECSECDGNGENECRNCNGTGDNTCSNCDGSGKIIEGDEEKDCPECEGGGTIDCDDCDGDGTIQCRYCDGDGRRECSECDGNGRVDCPECQ